MWPIGQNQNLTRSDWVFSPKIALPTERGKNSLFWVTTGCTYKFSFCSLFFFFFNHQTTATKLARWTLKTLKSTTLSNHQLWTTNHQTQPSASNVLQPKTTSLSHLHQRRQKNAPFASQKQTTLAEFGAALKQKTTNLAPQPCYGQRLGLTSDRRAGSTGRGL